MTVLFFFQNKDTLLSHLPVSTTFDTSSVTAVIGLVAKWTTKQASLHRAEERRSQRLALALATISPYLKDMETKQQNEIKGRLSDRLFGRIDDPISKAKSDDSEESFSVIKSLTDVIHDLSDLFQKKGP